MEALTPEQSRLWEKCQEDAHKQAASVFASQTGITLDAAIPPSPRRQDSHLKPRQRSPLPPPPPPPHHTRQQLRMPPTPPPIGDPAPGEETVAVKSPSVTSIESAPASHCDSRAGGPPSPPPSATQRPKPDPPSPDALNISHPKPVRPKVVSPRALLSNLVEDPPPPSEGHPSPQSATTRQFRKGRTGRASEGGLSRLEAAGVRAPRARSNSSAHVPLPVAEHSLVDAKWGVLFDGRGHATARFDEVARGIANYMVDNPTRFP